MAERARIRVTDGGNYVVEGSVPLKEMAPVHTMNGEPVAWHVLDDFGEPPDSYELCRCGRSGDKPFCDGSHEQGPWDSAETAARTSMPARVDGPEPTVHDERSLCVQAGFCATRTTSVWDLMAEGSDEARERAMEMVWRCPSGRLVYYDGATGMALEPQLPPEIAVVPGGPLWVRGGMRIESADGTPWPERNRLTLCRCGASANKPFCDGTHSRIHFDER